MKYRWKGRVHSGWSWRRSLSLPVLVMILGLAGCDSQVVYEKNINFQKKRWLISDTPTFRFEIADAQKTYNIYWNIRNTIAYPYRNLYLTYTLEDTLGHTLTTDLHDMLLFEPKTGEPYGGGLGDIFTHQIIALPRHRFDSAGTYQIRLQQYMRTDTLPEIVSVGIRIEEAGSGNY